MDNLSQLRNEIVERLKVIRSIQELEGLRVEFLGKSGKITNELKTLATLSIDEKKSFGASLNELKAFAQNQVDEKKEQFEEEAINMKLLMEKADLSLPTRFQFKGKIHPLSQVREEITAIFASMGFKLAEGPEIETDYYNFTALNIPQNHPARAMHDTFYINATSDEPIVLRTHTSNVQIRTMKDGKPPFRIISLGRTYRCDWDMTHTPMFHQVEGLLIDKDIHMGHLKGVIIEFARKFFEINDLPIRFRPSFFPFTEPSAEVDIGCIREGGELKIGAGHNWLEILGCGMVHPNVLKNVGVNPDEYQGFAFGAGIERLAMLKYGISDLRTFFEGDIRWLQHYGFSSFDIPSLVGGLAR